MLYEHWYQTVKKDWGEDRVRILAESAKAARRGAGRQPRSSRVKKANPRVDTTSPLPIAAEKSRKRTISPVEQRKEVIARQNTTESSGYTSNYSFMTNHAAPERHSAHFESLSMAQRRYSTPLTRSGSSKNGHFHPYKTPNAYRHAHPEHVTTRHSPRHPRRPESQLPLLTLDSEAHTRSTSTTAPRVCHQPLSLQQRQPLMIRDPTPEDDEDSLFVGQNHSEHNRRISVPRPNTELDAAVTMTMFRRQGMHNLRGTPPSTSGHSAVSRTIQHAHPDAHSYQRYIENTTPVFRLGSIVPRLDAVRRSQKQNRLGQLEKSDEDNENGENE